MYWSARIHSIYRASHMHPGSVKTGRLQPIPTNWWDYWLESSKTSHANSIFVAYALLITGTVSPSNQHNLHTPESSHDQRIEHSINTHQQSGVEEGTKQLPQPPSSAPPHEDYIGIPSLQYDYRGRPRRVESNIGIVAADQSRCSDIGAGVLQVQQ